MTMLTASPWAALLAAPPQRRATLAKTHETVRPGSKLASLLALLSERDSATTHTLSACTDLESRQVWGLLKSPRACGQVRFEGGRWSLVRDFAGRDVERAAALLRDLGWRLQPPNVELSGQRPERT